MVSHPPLLYQDSYLFPEQRATSIKAARAMSAAAAGGPRRCLIGPDVAVQ